MEKQYGNRKFKGVFRLTSWKKMAAIILAVQIGNENDHINNSTSTEKTQEKTKWQQIIYSSSLRRSLQGNRSTKPLICAMRRGLSLFPTLKLIDPLDTEKKSMKLQVNFFAFSAKTSCNTGRDCH